MTISSYQVDSVLRVYSRQNKAKQTGAAQKTGTEQIYRDKVSLNADETVMKTKAYEKISYNLLDIVLAGKEVK